MAHEHDEFFGYAADPAGAPPAPAPEPWASWPPIDVEGATAVARRSSVEPEMVMARHLAEGEGEPLVVTDAQRGWRARAEWDLAFLAEKYGDDDVIANDLAPLFVEDNPPMRTRRVKLREYIAYALGEQDNELAREGERGFGRPRSPPRAPMMRRRRPPLRRRTCTTRLRRRARPSGT